MLNFDGKFPKQQTKEECQHQKLLLHYPQDGTDPLANPVYICSTCYAKFSLDLSKMEVKNEQ